MGNKSHHKPLLAAALTAAILFVTACTSTTANEARSSSEGSSGSLVSDALSCRSEDLAPVYLTLSDQGLSRIDARGQVLWVQPGIDDVQIRHQPQTNSHLLLRDGRAVDLATNTITPGPDSDVLDVGLRLDDCSVLFNPPPSEPASPPAPVVRMDPDGSIRWEGPVAQRVLGVIDDYVVAATATDEIVSFALDDGAELWRGPLTDGLAGPWSPQTGNWIYSTTTDGLWRFFDPLSGDVLFEMTGSPANIDGCGALLWHQNEPDHSEPGLRVLDTATGAEVFRDDSITRSQTAGDHAVFLRGGELVFVPDCAAPGDTTVLGAGDDYDFLLDVLSNDVAMMVNVRGGAGSAWFAIDTATRELITTSVPTDDTIDRTTSEMFLVRTTGRQYLFDPFSGDEVDMPSIWLETARLPVGLSKPLIVASMQGEDDSVYINANTGEIVDIND